MCILLKMSSYEIQFKDSCKHNVYLETVQRIFKSIYIALTLIKLKLTISEGKHTNIFKCNIFKIISQKDFSKIE